LMSPCPVAPAAAAPGVAGEPPVAMWR